jgi:hypothetical protein
MTALKLLVCLYQHSACCTIAKKFLILLEMHPFCSKHWNCVSLLFEVLFRKITNVANYKEIPSEAKKA